MSGELSSSSTSPSTAAATRTPACLHPACKLAQHTAQGLLGKDAACNSLHCMALDELHQLRPLQGPWMKCISCKADILAGSRVQGAGCWCFAFPSNSASKNSMHVSVMIYPYQPQSSPMHDTLTEHPSPSCHGPIGITESNSGLHPKFRLGEDRMNPILSMMVPVPAG